MKAVILAAGKGERLRNAEPGVPKPMVEINGKPVLAHTVHHMVHENITHIVITVGHLGRAIMEYFGNGERFGVPITYSVENELLGTAGGLKAAMDGNCDEPFVIWNGDNFSNVRLRRMMDLHERINADITVAACWRYGASVSSVLGWNQNLRVNLFEDKPQRDIPGWVSTGIYIANPVFLKDLPERGDIGHDVLPKWNFDHHPVFVYGLSHDEFFRWYDSPEDLKQLRADYETH